MSRITKLLTSSNARKGKKGETTQFARYGLDGKKLKKSDLPDVFFIDVPDETIANWLAESRTRGSQSKRLFDKWMILPAASAAAVDGRKNDNLDLSTLNIGLLANRN